MPGHDLDLMRWIAEDVSTGYVDCMGNGRIDFADVVWLFTNL